MKGQLPFIFLCILYFTCPEVSGTEKGSDGEVNREFNRELILQHLESKPDSALFYINSDLSRAAESGNQGYQAWLELHKGLLFMFLNNKEKATEHIFASIQLYEELGDTVGLARGLLNYGNISSHSDSSRLLYYQQGLHYYKLKKDTAGMVKGLNNIGMFFLDNEKLDSAQHYVHKALALSKNVDNPQFIATSLVNTAILQYKGQGLTGAAIDTLRKVLRLPDVSSHRRIFVHSNHLLSQLYYKQQLYDSALVYIGRTLNLTKSNYYYLRSQAYGMLSSIHETKGDYRLAKNAQAKSDSIKIAIIQNDNRNLIHLLERENELRLNQERIKKLDAEVQRSFYVKLLLGILLGLAILFALFIIQSLRAKSRREKALLRAREQQSEAEQKLLQSELKRTQLESEYLNDRLNFTKGELSNYTANFVQHNNIIHEIHQQIDEVRKSINHPAEQQKLRDLSIQLNQIINRDDARRILIENALEVNNELFFDLKNTYPQLTEKDMHLISFIKLGLSSKEIADIYNIEPQSVHTKRYRLRKKLDLDSDESFDEFLSKRPADSRLQ